MTLQAKIKQDMVQAMRDHETEKVNLLRVVMGEFGRIGKEIPDDQAIKIIRKMSENAKEQNNIGEVNILETYLPKMYSEQQIKTLVANIIKGHKFKGMQHMGTIMGILSKHPDKMLIDNKIASGIVRELLA